MILRPAEPAKKWIILAAAPVCFQVLLPLFVPRGFALTAIGDLTQCILLLIASVAILRNVPGAEGRTRLFWILMSLGSVTWTSAQILWTYFEVGLRQDVPNPFVGDVVIFLHIVPMMAALAVQPHMRHDRQLARLGSLDVVLLLVGWLYLFLFLVIPWQYVSPNDAVYGHSFNLLYMAEHMVFLFGLAWVWRNSAKPWKTFYAQLFGAASLYAIGSISASVAIDFHLYYTGSFYDVPLIAGMTWFAVVGFNAPRLLEESESRKISAPEHSIWAPRFAMLAVFSTPFMVAWAAFAEDTPPIVRTYRLLLTVGIMLGMGFLVFVKQHLLDRELIHLLRESRQNLDEMVKLKDDLANKEQLVRWHSIELQQKNLELQQISFTDALTEVWNRRFLEETLKSDASQVLRNYQRTQGAASGDDHRDLVFIMVDVDFFKRVNDEHGHATGDELLRKVAERLSKIMRKSDVLVRWGGEEFMIMSRSADRAGTAIFCNRILDMMASEPFELSKGIKIRKSCSIGWAPYPWCESAFESLSAEEVIELADMALYRAKSLGRNQSVGFLPSDIALASPDKIRMENLRDDHSGLIKMIRTSSASKAGNVDPTSGTDLPVPPPSGSLIATSKT